MNMAGLVSALARAEDPGPLLAALRSIAEAGRVLRDVEPDARRREFRQLAADFAELELARRTKTFDEILDAVADE
jgi:hypothetical protein